MLKAILLVMLMVTVLSIGSSRNVPAISLDLAQYQWKNRLLLLFAPNRNHPFFDSLQVALVAQQAEVADRDLVIFEILESGQSSVSMTPLDAQNAQSLREKFEVRPGGFTVILIGKDGGIKLNNQKQTRIEDIFGLIDSMPMRREEMTRKSRAKESVAGEPNKSGGNQ
jgi:hypothetical protein